MKRRRSLKLTIGDFVIPVLLILFAITIILPLWYAFVVSIVPSHVFWQTRVLLWPSEITFTNYTAMFFMLNVQSGLTNTLFVTIVSTMYSMFLTVAFAYVMIKPIPGRRIFWMFLMTTMFFSGGLLPWYFLMVNLGLTNNIWALILPHGVNILHVILMQSYFRTLSPEYEESATIDGTGYIRTLWSIILPLSKPMLATIALFVAVSGWNRWFESVMLIQRSELWTLQHVIRHMLNMGMGPTGFQMAATFTAILPIMCLYPFLQKYFVKGITLGGIKG